MSQGTITPNVFDRLALAFGRAFKAAPPQPGALYANRRSSGPAGPISFPGWDEWYSQWGQQGQRDEATAKEAITSPWVYRDVNAIANEVSTSTVVMMRRVADDDDQELTNHPFEKLWEKPNPFMGKSFVMQFWTWQLLLSGEAYLYMRPVGGQLTEIWPVPSWMIEPIPDGQKFIAGYAFRARESQDVMRIDSRFICYSRLVHPFEPRRGLSPLVAMMTDVQGDLGMSRWNKNFFSKENAAPEGLISVNKDILDEDLQRVRQEMADFFSSGTRRVAIARAGDLAWQAFGRSQKDMEFLEGRRFTAEMIDGVFGIPAGYWSKEANRANSDTAGAVFISGAVWPKLDALSQDLNAQIIPLWYAADEIVTFKDIRPKNRALDLEEWKAHSVVRTVNELRAAVGDKPLSKDDPRGEMFLAELQKGTPLPATPASQITEDAMAAMEAEAGMDEEAPVEDVAPEPEAVAEDMALPPEEGASEAEAALKAAERRAWERKALKRGAGVKFVTEHLSDEEAAAIRAALDGAQDAAAIKAAFKAEDDVDALIDGEWGEAVKWARIALKNEGD